MTMKQSLRLNNNKTFSPVLRVYNSYTPQLSNKFTIQGRLQSFSPEKLPSPLPKIKHCLVSPVLMEDIQEVPTFAQFCYQKEQEIVLQRINREKEQQALTYISAILNSLVPIEPEDKQTNFNVLISLIQRIKKDQTFILSVISGFPKSKQDISSYQKQELSAFYYKNIIQKGKMVLLSSEYIEYQMSCSQFHDKLRTRKKEVERVNKFYTDHSYK